LITSVINHKLKILRLLLNYGANINDKLDTKTALHIICEKCTNDNNKEIIEELLLHKIDINCKTFKKYTALHLLSFNSNNVESVKLLLLNNANINIKDSDDRTPFEIAVFYDNFDIA